MSGIAHNAAGEDHRRRLAQALRDIGCDYLLGARVFNDGNLASVTPYLFDAHRGEISEPFASRIVDAQAVFKVAPSFADRIVEYLKVGLGARVTTAQVEVGCHFYMGGANDRSRKDVEVLARVAQRRLAQEIASSVRFALKASPEAVTWCANLSGDVSLDIAASASAEWSVAKDEIQMRPIVKVVNRRNLKEDPLLAIYLPVVARPLTVAASLPDDYAGRVRAFLMAVTDEDGSFPDIRASQLEESASSLSILQAGILGRSNELAALAAYRELSQSADNAESYYVLGKVLQDKKEDALALENLLEAVRLQERLSPEIRARLNEATGESYTAIGSAAAAAKFFSTAQTMYVSLHMDADVRRVVRSLATIHFQLGSKDEAVAELHAQPGLEKDALSLRLLGRFAALADKQDDAANWLSQALLIDPKDEEAKGLLSDVYATAGDKILGTNNYAGARRYFTLSLANRENVRVRYLSGYTAYMLDAYKDAIADFKKVTVAGADRDSRRWVEAAWLTMLECYLLDKEYANVETEGEAASRSLGNSVRVTNYLRFVAKILGDPSASAAALSDTPIYKALTKAAAEGPVQDLNWSNDKVDEFITKQLVVDSEKDRLLAQARKAVVR